MELTDQWRRHNETKLRILPRAQMQEKRGGTPAHAGTEWGPILECGVREGPSKDGTLTMRLEKPVGLRKRTWRPDLIGAFEKLNKNQGSEAEDRGEADRS